MELKHNSYLGYDLGGYIFCFVFLPLTVLLFYKELHDIILTAIIIALPIFVCYLIPFIGTNILKLWKFKAHLRIGNMPILHGLSFGSSINLFGIIMYKTSPMYTGLLSSIFFAFSLASVVTLWNLISDIQAVKDGYIVIYNKAYQEKQSPYDIVYDYAIPYFFTFGFIYSLLIKAVQYYKLNDINYLLTAVIYILAITIPTIIFMISSYIRNGELGLLPHNKGISNETTAN